MPALLDLEFEGIRAAAGAIALAATALPPGKTVKRIYKYLQSPFPGVARRANV